MATIATPVWTDVGTRVVSGQVLGRGNSVRGTIDLRSKVGAHLYLGIGRGGTTALAAAGINVEVRRTAGSGAVLFPGAPYCSFVSDTAAAWICTVASSGTAAIGGNTVSASGTFSGAADQDVCFFGISGTGVTLPASGTLLPNMEFGRIAKVSGDRAIVDAPFQTAKNASEIFSNYANQWQLFMPGGALVEVIFDYSNQTAGESVGVIAVAQTYDSNSST